MEGLWYNYLRTTAVKLFDRTLLDKSYLVERLTKSKRTENMQAAQITAVVLLITLFGASHGE